MNGVLLNDRNFSFQATNDLLRLVNPDCFYGLSILRFNVLLNLETKLSINLPF